MVTETKPNKNLKLGNWQVFLLDKLYQLYVKGSLCDVTLKFSGNVSIQAHKVVLIACTTFFDQLPSSSTGLVLHMPKTMKAHYVKPIINFMYSGKLEYKPEDQNHIYMAAKHLGMTVLTELLHVQESAAPSIVKTPDPKESVKKQVLKSETPTQECSTSDVLTSLMTGSTTTSGLGAKKLPIWKKRTSHQFSPDCFNRVPKKQASSSSPAVTEFPRPTRFDWPEDESLPDAGLSQTLDSFEDISYDTRVIVKPMDDPKPVILADSIEMMPISTSVIKHGNKRVRVSSVIRDHCEADDYDDNQHDDFNLNPEDDLESEEPFARNFIGKATVNPPKPILKNHDTSSPTPSKKVRFSLSSDKDDDNDLLRTQPPLATSLEAQSEDQTVSAPPPLFEPEKPKPINHAKIINEIIKKYPELIKNNKNIKLKIQTGTSPISSTITSKPVEVDKDGKVQKKVQYVVLKSDYASVKEPNTEVIGAENRSGPWFCIPCGKDKGPIHFESYYIYRRHLQEVHQQKIDARICEHCGFKSSKRNLHLYHLYTKHNVAPPRNINFPKCDQCDYIALSESLLFKHRNSHSGMISKEYVCRICSASFKSYGALMGHMQTNFHFNDPVLKKDYECEYCGKIFNRNINLKAHIRTSHTNESKKTYDDEERVDDPPEGTSEQTNDNMVEVIEVPVYEPVPENNKTLYLPTGMTILAESPTVPLMPSSESEAMNNVATGIATSINLTNRNISNDVIVIEGTNDLILRGAPTYVLNPDGSYSVQEYIVPDMLNDSAQVYTALVSTAPTTGISYVNTDNISLVSSSDHTYADGIKINGHITTTAQMPTVITPQVQTPQTCQPIIVQEPIIMSTNWVQSIATPELESQNVEVVTTPSVDSAVQTSQPSDTLKTAQTLASDWGDLEEETQDNSEDPDGDSEIKPSRPTIELNVTGDTDM